MNKMCIRDRLRHLLLPVVDGDAGVVDEDVEAAEFLVHLLGRRSNGGAVRHVQGERFHVEPFALQLECSLDPFGAVARGQQHMHAAGLRQLPGGFESDAFVGAGDECNLGHGFILLKNSGTINAIEPRRRDRGRRPVMPCGVSAGARADRIPVSYTHLPWEPPVTQWAATF